MNRRSYLTAIGTASAALLSGCSSLSGGTGDTSNGGSSDSSSSSPAGSPTPTPEPSPIENIGYEGKNMVVDLRPDSNPKLVQLLDPDGQQIERETINAETQVRFSLVESGASAPCERIFAPGEYTLAVGTQSGSTKRESVMLEPDVSIAGLNTPSSFGPRSDTRFGKVQYRGGFALNLENTGSLPACVTRTQIYGRDIPGPRAALIRQTTEQDSDSTELPEETDGAALEWYIEEKSPTNGSSEQVAVWLTDQWYISTYYPFVVPASKYGTQRLEGNEEKVREEYIGKKFSGVLTVRTSGGQHLGVPFRLLLSGEVRPVARLFGQNVYTFTNPQVAFNPQAAFDVANVSSNVSSIANNPQETPTFSENATGTEGSARVMNT